MKHVTPHEPLDLANALLILQRLQVAIRLTAHSIRLWAPLVKIPHSVRLTIRKHRAEVRALIARSDIIVCPAPLLHYQSWQQVGDQWYCCDCDRLKPWISGDTTCGKKRKKQIQGRKDGNGGI